MIQSLDGWPCGNKIKESKARIEGGSAAAMRAIPPLFLSARLYGPVLAVKGSASPRFAPFDCSGPSLGARCL